MENEETEETKTEPKAPEQQKPKTKKQQFLQLVIFTLCMASAGIIQILSFAILYDWTHWLPWWPAYLISVVLSVIWSFTFNRKFTFKAASNLPLAMLLVALYYCAFTPASVFGGNELTAVLNNASGKDLGIVTTVIMMLINFITEFFWEKFVVFNDAVMAKLERKLHIKHKDAAPAPKTEETALETDEAKAEEATAEIPEENQDDK